MFCFWNSILHIFANALIAFRYWILKYFCDIFVEQKMVNQCVAFGCSSEYDTNSEKISTFFFPLGKSDLIEKWIKFVNRNNWFPMKNSVLCIKYFEDKYILKGKGNKLNWNLLPIPTIHLEKKNKTISFADSNRFHKPPKVTTDWKRCITRFSFNWNYNGFYPFNCEMLSL